MRFKRNPSGKSVWNMIDWAGKGKRISRFSLTYLVQLRDPEKLFPHDHLMKVTLIPLIPKWVTPNQVTCFRFVLTPVLIWLLVIQSFAFSFALFLLLALSDAVDGSLARLRHQITEWGTLYDPIADKFLIASVVILVVAQHINFVFAILILLIDVCITLGAIVRKKKGKVMGSNVFGKTKMFLQVMGVGFLLLAIWAGYDLFIPVSVGTLCLAIVCAVISLFTYGI